MTEPPPSPVSWFLIESGWKVVTRSGQEVGEIEAVVGDSSADIFNGLSISTGFFREPRYVPAERVERIEEGRVVLALDEAAIKQLEEFLEPPPSVEIEGDEASAAHRLVDAVSDIETQPQRVTWWTRILRKLFPPPGR